MSFRSRLARLERIVGMLPIGDDEYEYDPLNDPCDERYWTEGHGAEVLIKGYVEIYTIIGPDALRRNLEVMARGHGATPPPEELDEFVEMIARQPGASYQDVSDYTPASAGSGPPKTLAPHVPNDTQAVPAPRKRDGESFRPSAVPEVFQPKPPPFGFGPN